MSAKEELLKVSGIENELYRIRTKTALGLDYAREADAGGLEIELAMADELFDLLFQAEKLANRLWKRLR